MRTPKESEHEIVRRTLNALSRHMRGIRDGSVVLPRIVYRNHGHGHFSVGHEGGDPKPNFEADARAEVEREDAECASWEYFLGVSL